MARGKFTEEEVKILKENPFVSDVNDTQILGAKRIERAAKRWRDSYAVGGLGAYHDGTVRNRVHICR